MLSASASSLRFSIRFLQLVVVAVLLTALGSLFLFPNIGATVQEHLSLHGKESTQQRPLGLRHPIDDLRQKAEKKHRGFLAKESHDVASAVRAYERKRGRRPPPDFDAWFEFAQANKAVIVEDFFDQIYDDLNPFWAIPALEIRQQASSFVHRISVRNGNTTQRTDIDQRIWMDLWQDLVGSIAQHLPDMDLAINVMDESRIIVPWETINEYMEVEKRERKIHRGVEVIGEYNSTAILNEAEVPSYDPEWMPYGPYWDHAVLGCPPSSPARTNYTPETDYTRPPPLPVARPAHSYKGYVSNWTLTKSPCDNPELQALHGTFVEPLSISNSRRLFPLFGGSKLAMNNEILLPPAMYWTADPFYSGGQEHGGAWRKKQNMIMWRGAASGGRNKEENWTRFQRHRFVAMMNGSSVRLAETSNTPPPNFELPTLGSYDVPAARDGVMGEWLDEVADAAFVHLLCFPDPSPPHCAYTDPWYKVEKSLPMKEQYSHKYLPDIDGNSFSGRYRGFLGSTSLPIKATIYNEWHDSRLVAWKHFVPMDNTFVDVYGIMDYFIGFGGKSGRDDVAESIALAGKEWAEKVLRREDMQIYVFRLLLEYARLCDDNRLKLGYLLP